MLGIRLREGEKLAVLPLVQGLLWKFAIISFAWPCLLQPIAINSNQWGPDCANECALSTALATSFSHQYCFCSLLCLSKIWPAQRTEEKCQDMTDIMFELKQYEYSSDWKNFCVPLACFVFIKICNGKLNVHLQWQVAESGKILKKKKTKLKEGRERNNVVSVHDLDNDMSVLPMAV